MAEDIKKDVIISVKVDTSDAQSSVNELGEKLNELGSNPIASKSFISIKDELREANIEAQKIQKQFGANSAEFANAAKKVALLKDEFQEYHATVEAFNPDNKLQSLVSLARGATGAIQGVTGAMSFLGVESDNANETIAKLQGLLSFSQALNSVDDIKNSFKNFSTVIGLTTSAREGASVATKGFGLALKGLGIGLVVSAIAYLVTNWDNLKESVYDLIPSLKGAGETFDKIKAIVLGVGNAVLQYAITPIKALIDIVKGDFSKAADDIKSGYNVIGNAQKGYEDARKAQADAAEKERITNLITSQENALKLIKASGQESTALEREIFQNKIKITKDGSKEREDAVVALSEFELANEKTKRDKLQKIADEAKQKREQDAKQAVETAKQQRQSDLEEISKDNEVANKTIAQQNKTAREIELDNLDRDFEIKKLLFTKYGVDVSKITEEYKIKEASINKKYDDEITNALKESTDRNLNEFDKRRNDIEKKYQDLLKNASPNQIGTLNEAKASELNDVSSAQKSANNISLLNNQDASAQAGLINSTRQNKIQDTDSPEERKQKIADLAEAQRIAEDAAFELKRAQLVSQNESIEGLKAQHETNIQNISEESADAQIAVDNAVKEAKINNLNAVGNAAGALSSLIGQNTAVGKALGVAQATIDTYIGANKALAQGGFLGYAQAAAVIATGLVNVKKIISTKIPTVNNGVSISNPSIGTPRTLNTTQIDKSATPQDVRIVNPESQVIKAIISDKELSDNEARKNFFNSISSF